MFMACSLATEHLLALGHTQIAYVGDRFGLHSDEERFAGYRKALSARQIAADKALVVRGDGKADEAANALDELLKSPSRPTAVACYNDMTALGLMRRADELGLSVPGTTVRHRFRRYPLCKLRRAATDNGQAATPRNGTTSNESAVCVAERRAGRENLGH